MRRGPRILKNSTPLVLMGPRVSKASVMKVLVVASDWYLSPCGWQHSLMPKNGCVGVSTAFNYMLKRYTHCLLLLIDHLTTV